MSLRPRNESEYPFEEFLKHFADSDIVRKYEHVEIYGDTVEIGTGRSFEDQFFRQRDYFYSHYSGDTARNYLVWFGQFSHYIAQNIEAFNSGRMAVYNTDPDGASLISQKLLKAVHDVLIHATDDEWSAPTGPPAERVVELCLTKYDED
jgi:hypothetical protein